jgi:hypothetical protein
MSCYSEIHLFNNVLTRTITTLRLWNGLSRSMFPTAILNAFLTTSMHATYIGHLSLFSYLSKPGYGLLWTLKRNFRVPSKEEHFRLSDNHLDRLCGQWSEFPVTDPEVRIRFPALSDFLRSSVSGTGFTQQLRSFLEEKVASPVYRTENTAVGDPSRWLCDSLVSAKVGTNVTDKRRRLSRYNLLVDSGHGVWSIPFSVEIGLRAVCVIMLLDSYVLLHPSWDGNIC